MREGGGLILGIESSCDETAAAVVRGGSDALSNVVASQMSLHANYGGVVPELASREHLRNVVPVVREAMARAGVTFEDLDAVAVTEGPGLAGALLVGITYAKALELWVGEAAGRGESSGGAYPCGVDGGSAAGGGRRWSCHCLHWWFRVGIRIFIWHNKSGIWRDRVMGLRGAIAMLAGLWMMRLVRRLIRWRSFWGWGIRVGLGSMRWRSGGIRGRCRLRLGRSRRARCR